MQFMHDKQFTGFECSREDCQKGSLGRTEIAEQISHQMFTIQDRPTRQPLPPAYRGNDRNLGCRGDRLRIGGVFAIDGQAGMRKEIGERGVLLDDGGPQRGHGAPGGQVHLDGGTPGPLPRDRK
jgi:hypothetical protein